MKNLQQMINRLRLSAGNDFHREVAYAIEELLRERDDLARMLETLNPSAHAAYFEVATNQRGGD